MLIKTILQFYWINQVYVEWAFLRKTLPTGNRLVKMPAVDVT